ncbi:uncharacterized protein TTLL1B isoform X5 [Dermacentor albipictus]|uniref:uncharacterized protein TTLL1B isoform X5 n=1 Tax=Dermacentor albipictus TaxID=60249 RepID=UPI0038FC2406
MMLVLLQPCPLKQEGSGWEFIGMIVDVMGLGLIVSGRFSVPAMPGLRARVVAVRSRESSGREIGQFVQLPTESPRDLDDGGECTRAVTSGEMTAAHSKWQQARKAICVRNRQRACEPLPDALRIDAQGPAGQAHAALPAPAQQSPAARRASAASDRALDVRPAPGLQHVRRRVQEASRGRLQPLDCQALRQSAGHRNQAGRQAIASEIAHQQGRYNQSHGGKWSLSSLETFVRGTRGSASAARLRQDLRQLVAHSLTAVAPSMLSDWHCFECYGYDVLLDEDLRPWLLEVNASPSLTSSTRADALLKQALVDDVLRLVAPSGKPSASAYSEADLGDFERILPAAQTPP